MADYAESYLRDLRIAVDRLLSVRNWPEQGGVQAIATSQAERALRDLIQPEHVYVLVNDDNQPVAYSHEMAGLREFLETDAVHTVHKVSRKDAEDHHDVTRDFVLIWINDRGDLGEEHFDDFLRRLGPWISEHHEDLARERFGADRG